MPKEAYFGHYASPKHIIVPTVNFCDTPPLTGWEQMADPITNNPTVNCEQISPVNYNIHPSPYVPNCNQQNFKFMTAGVFFNYTSTPEFPEKIRNPPLIYQNSLLTQATSSNMSQSIKELSSSKYKSRNNLVDLTGFNLLKRDSASSLTKRQDLKQIHDTKIEPDKIKSSSEKERRKTENITKEFAKNMKPMITNNEGNPGNHANGKLKENTNGNMKKCVREVWKRNFEKFKEKVAKEKQSIVIKSSSIKTRQDCKESKHESRKSMSKTHLQTSSKRNSSTKELKNKMSEGTKKYRDLERRLQDKYPKRSKSEKNSRNLQDSKVSTRHKEIDSSPDAIQKYKKNQSFISPLDDPEDNYKRQLKTKNLPRQKIPIESSESTNTKRKIDVKKKIDELKQYIKSEKHSKVQTTLEKDKNFTNIEMPVDQANTDKAFIKSTVRGDRNLPNNLAQRVDVEGVQDLRSKIKQSRKRSSSKCFVQNHKNSPTKERTVGETKSKKLKINENMKCPESNSGDLDQNPPEDLSFLDDLIIHADEIVASLPRSSQLEHLLCSSLTMKTTDQTMSELIKKKRRSGSKDNEANPKKSLINDGKMESIEINKTNGNYSQNNEETKSTKDLNNDDSMKATAMIEEEGTRVHKRLESKKRLINNMKVINLEIGSIASTKKQKNVTNLNQNTKKYRNSQHEENNNTDMTEKVSEAIRSKEAMRLCKDTQKIIITITAIKTKKDASTITDFTDLPEKVHEENAPKETTSPYKAKEIIITNSKHEINTNQEGKDIADCIGNDYKEIGTKETTSLCTANEIIITNSKNENQTEETNTMAALTGKDCDEIAPKATTTLCKDKEIIITNSKHEINTNQEGKEIVDLIGKYYEKIAPQETTFFCKAKEIITNSKHEINTNQEGKEVADLIGKDYKENTSKETTSPCKDKEIIITDSKHEINTNQEGQDIADFIGNDYEEIAPKETTSLCKAKEIIITNSKCEINTKQEGKEVTDLTGNDYEEIAPKETMKLCTASEIMSICRASKIIITNPNYQKKTEETNNLAELTGEDHEEIAPKETSLSKASEIIITNSKYENKIIEQPNNMAASTGKDYEEISPKKTSFCNAEEIIITNSKCEMNTYQEGKEITDLAGNYYKEIALKETRRSCKVKKKKSKHERNTNKTHPNYITDLTGTDLRLELCDDSDDSVVEVIDITDENERNTTSKHLQPNDNQTFETQVKQKSESSNTDQKQTLLHNDNSQNSKDTIETSLNKMFNSSGQNVNQIRAEKPKEISLQSVDAMEVALETILNGTQQEQGINNPSSSGQLLNEEILKAPPKTIIHKHNENGNEKIELKRSNVNKPTKMNSEAQESAEQILKEPTKNCIELNVGIQIDANPLNVSIMQENLSQKSGIYIAPLCRSNKTLKEQVQTFEETDLAKKPINDTEKSTQNGSENSITETSETVNSSLAENNEVESETLQISEETIQTSSNTTTVTEQKSDNRIQSNMSDKYVEKRNITLETSELTISEVSQEKKHTHWSHIEYQTDVAANEVTIPHNHVEDRLEKKSKVVTNTKKFDNKCLVPDGKKNKNETKSNEQEKQLPPKPRHYILRLESGMFKYLQKEFTITSIINVGRTSTIYKCIDIEGGAYALKVVRERSKGKFMNGIFSQMGHFRRKQDSCILNLMNAFEFQKERWCFLTEYFPKNLKQVLDENKRGFHIDQVQVLSRQLVEAVNIVARAKIIHTDIKPTHILLNSAQNRLKLCGFDRASYCSNIKITPSTGSPKYRAPEVILGFQENKMFFGTMDVWSTGLVIFEMATNKSLFNACFNNGLLYEQLCTFGSCDWTMVEKSKYRYLYFSGISFIRQLWPKGQQKTIIKHALERNDNLRKTLFDSYNQYWAKNKSKWQITKEMDKLETFYTLLQQMLDLDPRNRLPIEFVNASEFMTHSLTNA